MTITGLWAIPQPSLLILFLLRNGATTWPVRPRSSASGCHCQCTLQATDAPGVSCRQDSFETRQLHSRPLELIPDLLNTVHALAGETGRRRGRDAGRDTDAESPRARAINGPILDNGKPKTCLDCDRAVSQQGVRAGSLRAHGHSLVICRQQKGFLIQVFPSATGKFTSAQETATAHDCRI